MIIGGHLLDADVGPLNEIIALRLLQWLGLVLRIPAYCPPFRALLARAGQGRKKRRDGKVMTWRRGMKKLVTTLTRIVFPSILVEAQEMRMVVDWRVMTCLQNHVT